MQTQFNKNGEVKILTRLEQLQLQREKYYQTLIVECEQLRQRIKDKVTAYKIEVKDIDKQIEIQLKKQRGELK